MIPGNPIYHTLPQADYCEFIGCKESLDQIIKLGQPCFLSFHQRILIEDIGGIAQSTLTSEPAYRCLLIINAFK